MKTIQTRSTNIPTLIDLPTHHPPPSFLLSVLEFIGIVLIVGIKCSSQGTHIQPRNVKVSTCPDVVESGKGGGGLFEILSSWQAKKKKREDFI